MDVEKGIYLVLTGLLLIAGIIGMSLQMDDRRVMRDSDKQNHSEDNITYIVELKETGAAINFHTQHSSPFTDSKVEDVVTCSLYYDENDNVYYKSHNGVYVPYLKDDGSQYKWDKKSKQLE